MMSEPLALDDTSAGKVRCEPLDFVFPRVYRIWLSELNSTKDGLAHSSALPSIRYTLHPTSQVGRIRHDAMDSVTDLDHGWIILRHHRTAAQAVGYARAAYDNRGALGSYYSDADCAYVFRGHHFTLLHRPPLYGGPSPILIYSAEIPHRIVEHDLWSRKFGLGGKIINFNILPDLTVELDAT